MSALLPVTPFGPEDYLAWEATQHERHEYIAGEVFAVTGARVAHNLISLNAAAWLKQTLRGTPCRTFMADVKLQVAAASAYLYPDVMVSCDPRDRDADQSIAFPWLVVEVLSDSTAAYDRGRKFELYRELETLTHYLLVEQDRPHAELFIRRPAGQWLLQPLAPNAEIQIEALAQTWPVATLFEGVSFNADPAPAAAARPTHS